MSDGALRFLDPVVVSRLNNMELRARMIVEGFMTGLHKSPYHGFSVEFAEHRPYNPGDPLRNVDWKVYAKTDRYYVKQFEEETNLRNMVVLDTSPSMRYKGDAPISKLEYASYLAAGLHYLMLKQRDATGLVGFDDSLHTIMSARSTGSYLRQILSKLDAFVQTPPAEMHKTAAASVLSEVAERIARRSLVIVLTDLFENIGQHEALMRSLRHLRYRGHEVLVFHILDSSTERAFRFPDVPMVFRDMETGEELALQPSQLREHYQEAVAHFTERFKKQCREHHIDMVELDSGAAYDTALLAYLNKRRKML